MAGLVVFTLSAAMHEFAIAVPLRMVCWWAFIGMMMQIPMVCTASIRTAFTMSTPLASQHCSRYDHKAAVHLTAPQHPLAWQHLAGGARVPDCAPFCAAVLPHPSQMVSGAVRRCI
jgi:hypothetical protein